MRPRTADAASGDRQARPGADYAHSLRLLQAFRQRCPEVSTKSGLMLGLGETDDEVLDVMRDLRRPRCRHADGRPVPAAAPRQPAGAALRAAARSSTRWRSRHVAWDLRTPPAGRWCAPAITPTGRPTRPASEPRQPFPGDTMDHDPTPKPLYKSLYFQVITAIVIGVLLGHFWPQTGEAMKPLGDGFIKLIKMIIAPIIFCTVVVGIAGMEDMKKVGKTGGLALLYFEIVSTIALVVGLVIVNIVQPGAGMNVDPATLDTKGIAAYTGPGKMAGHDRVPARTSSRPRWSTPSPRARSCRCCCSR